jgi:hypothetical protein
LLFLLFHDNRLLAVKTVLGLEEVLNKLGDTEQWDR